MSTPCKASGRSALSPHWRQDSLYPAGWMAVMLGVPQSTAFLLLLKVFFVMGHSQLLIVLPALCLCQQSTLHLHLHNALHLIRCSQNSPSHSNADQANALPHFHVTPNDQPSRVSHLKFLPFTNLNTNISTAQSWSYDNFNTYPVMQLPPKKVKQMQKQIVDGKECEVEVEVEVVEERKCLFKLAPSLQVSR